MKLESWQDIYKSAFKDNASLARFLGHPIPTVNYPVFIPRPLAERIKNKGQESALAKQFIPHLDEQKPQGLYDPIGDQEFKQKGGRGAPEGLSLRTNRKARCYVVIEAKYTEDTQTHLTVDNVSGKGFKTIIDAGVYANCQPYGVSVELKNSGKSDNLPRREVTFHSA